MIAECGGEGCRETFLSDKFDTFCNTEFSFAKERKTLVKVNTFLLTFLSVSLVLISKKQAAVRMLS